MWSKNNFQCNFYTKYLLYIIYYVSFLYKISFSNKRFFSPAYPLSLAFVKTASRRIARMMPIETVSANERPWTDGKFKFVQCRGAVCRFITCPQMNSPFRIKYFHRLNAWQKSVHSHFFFFSLYVSVIVIVRIIDHGCGSLIRNCSFSRRFL